MKNAERGAAGPGGGGGRLSAVDDALLVELSARTTAGGEERRCPGSLRGSAGASVCWGGLSLGGMPLGGASSLVELGEREDVSPAPSGACVSARPSAVNGATLGSREELLRRLVRVLRLGRAEREERGCGGDGGDAFAPASVPSTSLRRRSGMSASGKSPEPASVSSASTGTCPGGSGRLSVAPLTVPSRTRPARTPGVARHWAVRRGAHPHVSRFLPRKRFGPSRRCEGDPLTCQIVACAGTPRFLRFRRARVAQRRSVLNLIRRLT